jgi:hypothetical protein
VSATVFAGDLSLTDQRGKFGRYALVVLVMGALGRLLWKILARPTFSLCLGDMSFDLSYAQAAQNILWFNFHALGFRAPVYPFLLALCDLNPRAILVAQSIFGIAASLMIFDIAFRRTRHGPFSLLVGLACSLIPELLAYEYWVMTEALTNFLLVTSLWLITRGDGTGESNIRYPLGLGSIVALAGLTRPLMICLVPVYYCCLVPLWPPAKILRRGALKKTLFFTLPVIVLILGWCGFNYFNSGYFTPTTRAGQHLMMQVDPYVALAPDRFAVLRDAWLRSRQQTDDDFSRSPTAVYDGALPEMERQTRKTESQVCHELLSLALYLESHHPLLCLRRAELGWIMFWGKPTSEEVKWVQGGNTRLVEFVTAIANFLVREVKGAFLVLALLSVLSVLLRLKIFTKVEYLIFTMVLWASVFAAFTDFGENNRYCVPFYMLIVYTLMTRGWLWITATSLKGADAG